MTANLTHGSAEWRDRAACKGQTDRMYLKVFEPLAKATCAACPVQDRCLVECMATETPEHRYGVIGGLDPDQRRNLWRRQRRGMPRSVKQPIRHGTQGGYQTHVRRGEPACGLCREANNVSAAERRDRYAS